MVSPSGKAEDCKSFIPSSNLGAAFFKIDRPSHRVCCFSDLWCDATSGLTAEHRFIGSSLPNLSGKYTNHDRFDRVVGLDGILLISSRCRRRTYPSSEFHWLLFDDNGCKEFVRPQ